MKRNASNPAHSLEQNHNDPDDPLNQQDPLWDMLGKASKREPDTYFARNVLRAVRTEEVESLTWGQRLSKWLGGKSLAPMALSSAAACAIAAFAAFQFWPSPSTTPTNITSQNQPANTVTDIATTEETTELAEVVIKEGLAAAADDPTMFTHDEVVAMLGL